MMNSLQKEEVDIFSIKTRRLGKNLRQCNILLDCNSSHTLLVWNDFTKNHSMLYVYVILQRQH